MTQGSDKATRRIEFDPAAPEAWLQRLHTALREPVVGPLVVDMAQTSYTGPAALGALQAAADAADAAGRELWLDRVPAPVYKVLQVARLAARFRRVHHGTDRQGG
ncbi:STAS domain-containing protein [Candidatus Binatia bacterium]|nr:STAS domain-containing protein [Candidatus Binatia bacterium]